MSITVSQFKIRKEYSVRYLNTHVPLVYVSHNCKRLIDFNAMGEISNGITHKAILFKNYVYF